MSVCPVRIPLKLSREAHCWSADRSFSSGRRHVHHRAPSRPPSPVLGPRSQVPRHRTCPKPDGNQNVTVTNADSSQNAKVAHHESHIIHSHPSSPTIPDDPHKRMDASMCPAVHSLTRQNTLENEICPVVGAVSAYLPPTHPKLTEQESGKVCPVTNATLAHHEGKLHLHPSVADDAPVSKCPVAGASMNQ
ncbi:hypothetical protein LTR12_007715 [Friedmanniomyces endolithicus]|nr:hypothetical protein LTR12_007715 [Friedmanniomyces endolithicus]